MLITYIYSEVERWRLTIKEWEELDEAGWGRMDRSFLGKETKVLCDKE